MNPKTQREWLNTYRAENRKSITALAADIGIPGHVLRRFIDKCTKPAYFNRIAIEEFIQRN